MRNQDVERMLSRAVAKTAPDVLTRVLNNWPEPDAPVNAQPARSRLAPMRRWALAAAALVLLISGGGYWRFHLEGVALMDLDVNPAIELRFNRRQRVISANPVNADGERALAGMELRGATADVAVNALLGSMFTLGYLDDHANTVLISTQASDPAIADALRELAEQAAGEAFARNAFDGAVLSQRIEGGDQLRNLAEGSHTSLGKAALVERLILINPALSFDAVKDVSVTDLSLVLSSKAQQPEGMRFVGAASGGKYIGQARAIQLALACHEQSAENVSSLTCEMDIDHGRMVYEVEFRHEQYDYECSIDALTGEMLEWEVEWAHPLLTETND